MDGAKFRTILEENLLELATELGVGRRFLPPHKARATIEWFQTRAHGLFHTFVVEGPLHICSPCIPRQLLTRRIATDETGYIDPLMES